MTGITLTPLTMQAAADFWRDKVKLGPAEFAALSDEAKIRAFGISGIAKGDELTTVFNALQSAIEKGISYGEFKKQCAEIFARRGWTGKREWRVQNIFRTNIQTAYNSGRWQQQKEVSNFFPYLQYNAVNDRRTRPTHKALDGKVFPIDHPFWDSWYPPNGYRCRCSTLSLTEGQVKRLGLTVETEDPTDHPIEIASPVTGAKMTVQQLLPDAGFDHHPGKTVWGGIGRIDDGRSYLTMEGLAGPGDYGRRPLAAVDSTAANLDGRSLLPPGQDEQVYREAFLSRYGEEILLTDGAGEPVILTLRSLTLTGAGQGETIPLLSKMLEQPYEIWLTPQQDQESGRVRLAKRYVALWKGDDLNQPHGMAVAEVVDGTYRGLTAYVPDANVSGVVDRVEEQRRGLLLYPKKGKQQKR